MIDALKLFHLILLSAANIYFMMPEDPDGDRLMVSVHYVDNAKFWSNRIGNKGVSFAFFAILAP